MNTLPHLIHRITAKARFTGIEDALDAEPWLDAYRGDDWRAHLDRIPAGSNNLVLLQNRYAQLKLIRWEGHFRSTKHGHPERGCLLKVLAGTLIETRYDPVDPERVSGAYTLLPGDMAFIHDALAYHVVENPLTTPAVSLHLYSPGVYEGKLLGLSPAIREKHPGLSQNL